jgi:hypothetical protein
MTGVGYLTELDGSGIFTFFQIDLFFREYCPSNCDSENKWMCDNEFEAVLCPTHDWRFRASNERVQLYSTCFALTITAFAIIFSSPFILYVTLSFHHFLSCTEE